MKTKSFLTLLIIALITACNKSEDDIVIPPINQPNPIRLTSLEVGQKSMYLRYYAICEDVENSFEWTKDTLILEVIGNGEQLQLQESLTLQSPMYLAGSFQEPIRYPVRKIASGLLLPERFDSALFFFYANDTLRIDPKNKIVLTQEDCYLMQDINPFIGNDIGQVSQFQFGSIQLTDKTAVSCEPFFNLDAYLFYNKEQLFMSHVLTFDLDTSVYGWQLIEN